MTDKKPDYPRGSMYYKYHDITKDIEKEVDSLIALEERIKKRVDKND